MAIDINELRRLTQAALAGPDGISLNWIKLLQDFQQKASPSAISELLDRLEAAESEALEQARLNGMGGEREAALMAKLEAAEIERDALRALVVMRFDHDRPPQFTQGYDTHELTEPVTAEHCRWFVDEIERLRAEVAHIKEVEFPRKAQAVADGWRGKLEATEKERDKTRMLADRLALALNTSNHERDNLRVKVAEMERQEPVGKFVQHPSNGLWEQDGYGDNPDANPLYALPGAQAQPAPSMPEVTDTMALAFHHALTDGSIGAREVEEIKDALHAALAAAPQPEGE